MKLGAKRRRLKTIFDLHYTNKKGREQSLAQSCGGGGGVRIRDFHRQSRVVRGFYLKACK